MIPIVPEELIPLSKFRQMRMSFPVQFQEQKGSWHVYKYEDVKTVLSDHERFSSQFQTVRSNDEPIESSVLRRDPPKHRQLRSLVSQAFSPRAVEALIPLIRSVTHQLLDEAQSKGAVDALREFAGPLPVIVIAEMLGIPREDRDRFKQWSDELVGNDSDNYFRCQKEMTDYFSSVAEQRRREPQDDLISRLTAVNVDDERLSDAELIGFCILLLVAGNETTTNFIGSAILCLDGLPDERDRLAADSDLVPQALEEVLRYCSPVQTMVRRVVRDTELRGQRLIAGQHVHVRIGSANHDEDVFERPDIFDGSRNPNPHVAFGHGIHFCLGSQLARLEAGIAVKALLERFPRFARDRSYDLKRLDSWIVFGVNRLPVRLN
ncbi:cytochrome P450 [Paenibacillus hemerocallicola]|uniref:Cytochrome P450 n=1 Tax=Paenibacillus hemerocallicola TaxID=1172614 RepID=A0A5C4TGE0_9BACL|nr:cytochrome P450 [Paenibacillus hemerocallicola]TNJ67519.1 cytochrome P450 [Paenibacillus hemerocallicola]